MRARWLVLTALLGLLCAQAQAGTFSQFDTLIPVPASADCYRER